MNRGSPRMEVLKGVENQSRDKETLFQGGRQRLKTMKRGLGRKV
jgi:hypothetical protein